MVLLGQALLGVLIAIFTFFVYPRNRDGICYNFWLSALTTFLLLIAVWIIKLVNGSEHPLLFAAVQAVAFIVALHVLVMLFRPKTPSEENEHKINI